jgi:malate dehydrogenase
MVSMGVVSDGSYGIPKGMVSSFPVTTRNFTYSIAKNLELNQREKDKINASVQQMKDWREIAMLTPIVG